MTEAEQRMLETDPDYISLRRFNNSLAKLEERYPDGCPDHIIAAALGTSEEDIVARYNRIVKEMRADMHAEE